MDKLKKYMNSLSCDEQVSFSYLCGTTVGYLRRAISGRVRLGPQYCVSIEKNSNGQVTRKDLRPDDWHLIWPELVGEVA